MAVYRVYTEKNDQGYDVEARALRHELRHILLMKSRDGACGF